MLARTESMGAYRPGAPVDFLKGRPMEVDAIVGEPHRRAMALGVGASPTGLLAGLVEALDRRRTPLATRV